MEIVPLVRAGNHAPGHPVLRWVIAARPGRSRNRIDEIAQAFDGFYFGRFDVRYADVSELMAGRRFAIVELNGVTSEATHIYRNPAGSLGATRAPRRTLMHQWSMAFAIGAADRARGHRPATVRRLVQLPIWEYWKTSPTRPIAD